MRSIYNEYGAYDSQEDHEFRQIDEGLYEFLRTKMAKALELGLNPREISHHIQTLTGLAEAEVMLGRANEMYRKQREEAGLEFLRKKETKEDTSG